MKLKTVLLWGIPILALLLFLVYWFMPSVAQSLAQASKTSATIGWETAL